MTKENLRQLYLEKRKGLTEAEYLSLNRQLCEIFFSNVDLNFIKVIHVFLPITEKREVDTWLLIDRIRREFPHIRFSIPRVNNNTGKLDNLYFEGLHQLQKNKWGILEPKQGIPTPPEKIDMVLAPLLAFDHEGHRVGYGKGYYDKFLAECTSACRKIGCSLFEPENEIETEGWDIQLDGCVTPNMIYYFN